MEGSQEGTPLTLNTTLVKGKLKLTFDYTAPWWVERAKKCVFPFTLLVGLI